MLSYCCKCQTAARLLLRNLSKANVAVLTVAPSSGSESACCFSSAGPHDATYQLSSADLHYTAKLARLSGLCYGHPEKLAAKLQVEGLQVEAQGQTSFTRSGMHAVTCLMLQLTSALMNQQVVCRNWLLDTAACKTCTACQASCKKAANS